MGQIRGDQRELLQEQERGVSRRLGSISFVTGGPRAARFLTGPELREAECRRSGAPRRRSGPPAGRAAPAGSRRRCHGPPGESPARPVQSGSAVTRGVPASACSRSASDSGTLPSSGMSSSSASSWPPPSPKIVKRSPSGVVKPDMFSIAPSSSRSNLSGHVGAAFRHRLRRRLRRGDDQELGLGEELGERHRDVAGPRWQVEQQVLQLAPGDVLEELLDRLVQHRPAPDDGGVLLDEEADRHHLDATGRFQRQDLALAVDLRFAVDAEHARDRVAVDVAVERPGRVAFGGQRRGQVGGHRRLADAALAGGDADHVFHLGQRAGRQLAAAERLLQGAFLLVGEDVEADARPRSRRPARRPGATACSKWERIGQPAVVSETTTSTRPLSLISIERTMPSSTIERRSSGSMTARSFSVI